MKVIVRGASVRNMGDLINAVDHNAILSELLRIKQAKTNRRLFVIMAAVTFVTFMNYGERLRQNEEIEKLKIRLNDLDDVEGENGM